MNEQIKLVENNLKRKLEETQAKTKESKVRKRQQDEENKSIINSLQGKLLEKESKEASEKKFGELKKRDEIATQRIDRQEERMDVQEELIAGMRRQLLITNDQQGERLNVLERRADNQEERAENLDRRIDDLQPLAGSLYSSLSLTNFQTYCLVYNFFSAENFFFYCSNKIKLRL